MHIPPSLNRPLCRLKFRFNFRQKRKILLKGLLSSFSHPVYQGYPGREGRWRGSEGRWRGWEGKAGEFGGEGRGYGEAGRDREGLLTERDY